MIEIQGTSFNLGITIQFVSTVKNLGIYMDNKLTFDSHVTELKKRCFGKQNFSNINVVHRYCSHVHKKIKMKSCVNWAFIKMSSLFSSHYFYDHTWKVNLLENTVSNIRHTKLFNQYHDFHILYSVQNKNIQTSI